MKSILASIAMLATPALAATGTDARLAVAGPQQAFTLSEPTIVSYGVASQNAFHHKLLPPGAHVCGGALFGDPARGVDKSCYVAASLASNDRAVASSPPPAATTAMQRAAPTPALASRGDGEDRSDASRYRALAADMGTDAGIRYRYGEASNAPVSQTTYPGPRPSKSYRTLSIQREEMQRDGVKGNRGCGANGWCGEYQIGDYLMGEPGDFSSSIANVAYLPDPTAAGKQKAYGVASLQVNGIAHNVVSWKPEVSWTTYTGADSGWNDENTKRFSGDQATSPIGTVPMDQRPVAAARGYGRGGWINNTLTVFANGWILSSGSNTSHNFVKLKLPDRKTPTAIAITNSGEFALVTVWDTAALRGQIAVIALTDGCQGCETTPAAQWGANWGSHRDRYPGLPGLGNYLGAKLLGFVDLPAEMKAPTEISATTGKPNDDYQRVRNFFQEHIQTPTQRQRYLDGDLSTAIARTGMAVVISKSEKKAAFVDLRPLFSFYRLEYFAKTPSEFDAMLANRGDAPSQFPPTFDVAPRQMPTVARTIALPHPPTAVKVSLHAPHRAYIATQEGALRVFTLGDAYLDPQGLVPGEAAHIRELFQVRIGANPTSIAYVKEKAALNPEGASALFGAKRPEDHLWVLSRAERKATLLQFNGAKTAASPLKTLQDSRMGDAIAIEDVDNHGTESYLLTVADYAGRSVRNYAYGPLVMWTYDPAKAPCPKPRGCRLQGDGAFEYAGSYTLPGRPFGLSISNIN